MQKLSHSLKLIVTAIVVTFWFQSPLFAQTERLDELFIELADSDDANWQKIEREIWTEWAKSGSASMDLLLERGRNAMEQGDLDAAIEHLTALTDHAPDFAEGWNARATAYFQRGLYGPSIEDIQRTLALNPRHFGAISGLGMILEQLGYPDDALKAYREVQSIHPNRPSLIETIERLEKKVGGTDL
jgi:tetratricopeptide (TPR) repeat protein